MDTSFLRRAFEYKAWSDGRTLGAISTVDVEARPASVAFALQQLDHMVTVEELFRARLSGATEEPHVATNTGRPSDPGAVRRRVDESNAWLAAYVKDVDPAALGERVNFVFVDGTRNCRSRLSHSSTPGSWPMIQNSFLLAWMPMAVLVLESGRGAVPPSARRGCAIQP